MTYAVVGCATAARDSSQIAASIAVAAPEKAHGRVDVLFARDAIEHSTQAVALGNLVIGKEGVGPQVADVARQIAASSTRRIDELQALLADWGFTPMTVRPAPRADGPGVPVQPGEHPLASDTDFRLVREANGSRSAELFLDLMIRQHQFTTSLARAQLQSGTNPGAMAIARSLIESQKSETSAMEGLKR